jgi:murein DD-endopeptidase MepM/ murein hydrolase activator NlpD
MAKDNRSKLGAILTMLFVFIAEKVIAQYLPSSKVVTMLGIRKIRTDEMGEGHYHASRGGRLHHGIDYVVTSGQPIYAPEDMSWIRASYPYENSILEGARYLTGWGELTIWYFTPVSPVASNLESFHFKKGDLIGHAQSVSSRYGSRMKDHIHLETYSYDKEKTVNPKTYGY